jgi:two-component system, LytTR family, response regulator
MSGSPVGVVIVNDEPPARDLLRGYAQQRPELSLIGEAEDGVAAVELIWSTRPEVVFLRKTCE